MQKKIRYELDEIYDKNSRSVRYEHTNSIRERQKIVKQINNGLDYETCILDKPSMPIIRKKCTNCNSVMILKPVGQPYVTRPSGIIFVETDNNDGRMYKVDVKPQLAWFCDKSCSGSMEWVPKEISIESIEKELKNETNDI